MVYQILVNVINTHNLDYLSVPDIDSWVTRSVFHNLDYLSVPIASMHFAAAITVLC